MEIKKDDVTYADVLKITIKHRGTSIKRLRSEFGIDFLRAKNFYRRLVDEHIIDDKSGQLIKARKVEDAD